MTPGGMSAGALATLQRDTFGYFVRETDVATGLVPDNNRRGAPASITAVGLALAAYPVGVERQYLSRAEAAARTLTTLRTFWESPQGEQPDATGYKGFYYHFLDLETCRRTWDCELSTIDTTFLLAGALTCAQYFDRESPREREIRRLADALYRRVDWQWALDGGQTVTMGWKPETGFLPFRWEGYNEAMLLYVLGLGSPTHPLPDDSYAAWTRTYRWEELYGLEFLYGGPLYVHQLSHVWIDFRGIQDDFMRGRGIDYFENSRRATYVQRQYAIENPHHFRGYNENCWGITASDGPGPATLLIDGVERHFYDYIARQVPWGPDDGTIAPWASITSLPFAPEIVLSALRHFTDVYPEMSSKYGFKCSFNPTFHSFNPTFRGRAAVRPGWISKGYYGLDQGPIVLMIENYRSGFLWRLMRQCPYLVTGLRRAGFRDGWLSEEASG
ncbi:MAG: glucoamylase family protein [Gemmatimonadales bacterium]